jgi:hypothetical protein
MNRLWPLLLFLTLLVTGCVPEQQHKLRPQPADVQPSRLGVWATFPEDTDANGYLDTTVVTVYISSDTYPAPIAVPGSFVFRLMSKDGKELAKWDIPEDKAIKAARKMPAGPAYFFRLCLLDVGTDKIDAAADAQLTAEFKPRSGEVVRAPLTKLQFGRTHS